MRYQTVYLRPTVIVGVALAMVIAVTGIFAPVLAPHDPNAVNPRAIYCPPVSCANVGQSHILGTDHLGRDVLSRIVTSLRIYLYIGLLGTLLGLLAAWLLVIVRSIRSAAIAQNMPHPLLGIPFYGLAIVTYIIGVFLSITILSAVGQSLEAALEAAIVCAGVFSSLLPMALVYGSVRGDRASSGPVRLAVRRGIALSPIGFSLALLMGIFIAFSLSFLGIGVPPSTPSLGNMTAQGRDHLVIAPWISVFPLGIVLVAVGAFSTIVIPVGRILSLPAQAGMPAGFWIRLAAHMIDLAVLTVLYAVYVIIASQSASAEAILTIACLTALVWILVTSPGKRALSLYVLRPDGSRVGLGRKFFRFLAWIFGGYIVCLMIAFRKDKRGLHDLICDTVVVRLEWSTISGRR